MTNDEKIVKTLCDLTKSTNDIVKAIDQLGKKLIGAFDGVCERKCEKTVITKNDMCFCGECKNALAKTWNFCPKCGTKMKGE